MRFGSNAEKKKVYRKIEKKGSELAAEENGEPTKMNCGGMRVV